jgi:hypothetical protein
MYVDLVFLFLIYIFATIALGVSIYALWTLEEIKSLFTKKTETKPPRKPLPPIKVERGKGHWD